MTDTTETPETGTKQATNEEYQLWPLEPVNTDRGVTPVISVILMVAVTVILAAIVGAFAFGLAGSQVKPAPDTTIQVEDVEIDATSSTDRGPGYTVDYLNISHENGDTLYTDEIHIEVENTDTGDGFVLRANDAVERRRFMIGDTMYLNLSNGTANFDQYSRVYGNKPSEGSGFQSSRLDDVKVTIYHAVSDQKIAEKEVAMK